MSKSKFTFPVGYHDFHKDQVFNFQLNRWCSFGYARSEDMQEAGQKIENFTGNGKGSGKEIPLRVGLED